MRRKPTIQHIESLTALLLFGVFAVSVLLILLMGASTYTRLTARSEASYNGRTVTHYLAERVRQGDALDSIRIGRLGEDSDLAEGDAIFFEETINGTQYVTCIYRHQGYLRETFTEKGTNFAMEDGEEILPITDLKFSWNEDRRQISVEVTDREFQQSKLVISPRSRKERT